MLNNFDRELEDIHGLETDYIKILYYDLPKNFSGEYKTYSYSRFCTILHGEKKVTLNNNKKFTYNKNDYLLLPPHSKVHMNMKENTAALVFEFSDKLLKDVLNKVDFSNEIKEEVQRSSEYFLGENKFNISNDVYRILVVSDKKENKYRFLIDLYAQKLIFDLVNSKARYAILNSSSDNPINRAIKFIDDNIQSTISIKSLSKELHMSESNFSHLFKKIVGINPVEYIKNKKLELALEYLKTQCVTEVAYNLGYSNISYFIKLFKNKYNMTPKQYKMTICNASFNV